MAIQPLGQSRFLEGGSLNGLVVDGAPSPGSHRAAQVPLVPRTRRLVAVFAEDADGYSRLMGADEIGAFKGLRERRAILDGLIGKHRGRIANTAGDSILAEFGRPWTPCSARWMRKVLSLRRTPIYHQRSASASALVFMWAT